VRRFIAALILGAVWGLVCYHWLSGIWLFIGAGAIGMLLTIGLPTRRRRERKRTAQVLARASVRH
jgi:hypothetical protein